MKRLNNKLRKELKRPIGEVLDEKNALKLLKDKEIICVGDSVSYSCLPLKPKLIIYDNKIMRKESDKRIRNELNNWESKKIEIKNPAGYITNSAFNAIKNALKENKKTKIEVHGEEDLLAIPCILSAPIGTFVVYGQPLEGMVVVEVTDKIKNKVKRIYESMDDVNESPVL